MCCLQDSHRVGQRKPSNICCICMDCMLPCVRYAHKQRERERERGRGRGRGRGSNGDRFKWSDHRMVVSTSQWFVFLATISIFINPLLIESRGPIKQGATFAFLSFVLLSVNHVGLNANITTTN